MASVTQFAQFLLNNEPQKNVGRLALYHFLKNFDYLKMSFDENIIKEFYIYAFLHEYWRNNRQSLEKLVAQSVEQFSKIQPLSIKNAQDQGLVKMQVISLENEEDQNKAIKVFLYSQFKELSTGQKLIHSSMISKSRNLCLIQNTDQSLEVLVFTEHFTIVEGHLVPLSPVTHLQYNSQLELREESVQKLELNPHVVCRWENRNGALSGYLIRGYTFQKVSPFHIHKIQEKNELFLALKNIESHFLNMSSDPFYKETITLLEKSIQFLETQDEVAIQFGTNTLKKAQYALKSIFSHDKLLTLLVSNLEYALIKAQMAQKELNPWLQKSENQKTEAKKALLHQKEKNQVVPQIEIPQVEMPTHPLHQERLKKNLQGQTEALVQKRLNQQVLL